MLTKITTKDYQKINFLYWNEENNYYYVYYEKRKLFRLKNFIDIFNGDTNELVNSISINDSEFNVVTDVKFNIETEEFIICYFDKISVYNKNGNLKFTLNIEGVISSKYYNKNELLLEIYEFSNNRSLGLFNTQNKTFKKYKLESIGHYNRNFKIENTNSLLYGLCNAYENRMYLHILNFEKNVLNIVCEKGLYCERSEIENSSIEINAIGDEFLFIANEDYERMTICLYSIYNQKNPTREIPIEKEKIPILHLLLDKYILIEYNDKFGLLNLEIKDSLYNNESKTFNFFEKDKIKITCNRKSGKILYYLNNEIHILQIDDKPLFINEERKNKMKDFIKKIINNEFETAEVDTYY